MATRYFVNKESVNLGRPLKKGDEVTDDLKDTRPHIVESLVRRGLIKEFPDLSSWLQNIDQERDVMAVHDKEGAEAEAKAIAKEKRAQARREKAMEDKNKAEAEQAKVEEEAKAEEIEAKEAAAEKAEEAGEDGKILVPEHGPEHDANPES